MRKKNEIQRPVMWWVIEADRKELRNEPPSTKRQSNRRKRTPQESVFFESFQSYQVSHRDVWESIYNRRRPKMRFFQPSLEKEKKNEWKKRRNPLFFQVFTNSQLVHDYVLLTTFFFFCFFFRFSSYFGCCIISYLCVCSLLGDGVWGGRKFSDAFQSALSVWCLGCYHMRAHAAAATTIGWSNCFVASYPDHRHVISTFHLLFSGWKCDGEGLIDILHRKRRSYISLTSLAINIRSHLVSFSSILLCCTSIRRHRKCSCIHKQTRPLITWSGRGHTVEKATDHRRSKGTDRQEGSDFIWAHDRSWVGQREKTRKKKV